MLFSLFLLHVFRLSNIAFFNSAIVFSCFAKVNCISCRSFLCFTVGSWCLLEQIPRLIILLT